MTNEFFTELMDFSCPLCGSMILIIGYPTEGQTASAAEAGNSEAQWQLVHTAKNRTPCGGE